MQFKWLTVPWTNKTKQVQAIQLWEVRWKSVNESCFLNSKSEVEAFPTKEEADSFAESLSKAFDLVRQGSQTYVSVSKSKSY